MEKPAQSCGKMSGVCIISRDRLFARMLELELIGDGIEVKTFTDKLNPAALKVAAEGFSVTVFDADYYGRDIGLVSKWDRPVIVFSREELDLSDSNLTCFVRPFSVSDFKAAVHSLYGEPSSGTDGEDYSDLVAEMELDPYSKRVLLRGKTIKFSPKEFSLLSLLYRNRGKTVSRQDVLEAVWGQGYDPKNNVDNVYINYLRNKLDAEFGVKMIYTVRGKGYMLK